MTETVASIDNLAEIERGGDSTVLNPTLYDLLVQRLGDVIVAKQGEAMHGGGYVYEGGGQHYKPLHSGEYYRVCCPFCEQKNTVDTRHRLWINHRWGVGLDEGNPDYSPQEKFWWMAACYNENCMEAAENRKELRTMIYGGIGRENHGTRVTIRPGTTTTASLGLVSWPGRCVRLDMLRNDHSACTYLRSRSLNPNQLAEDYNVSFCHESPSFPIAEGRIVVPIIMRGQMVGWQARPPYDINWSVARVPKYYNRPGTNKRLMLYGYDRALTMPFCTLVEGVTDVWALGRGALSVLGKDLSPQQAEMVTNSWKAAVIALDPDAHERVERFKTILQAKIPVVVVNMPAGLDPATIDNDYFWDLVYAASLQAGVDLLSL